MNSQFSKIKYWYLFDKQVTWEATSCYRVFPLLNKSNKALQGKPFLQWRRWKYLFIKCNYEVNIMILKIMWRLFVCGTFVTRKLPKVCRFVSILQKVCLLISRGVFKVGHCIMSLPEHTTLVQNYKNIKIWSKCSQFYKIMRRGPLFFCLVFTLELHKKKTANQFPKIMRWGPFFALHYTWPFSKFLGYTTTPAQW